MGMTKIHLLPEEVSQKIAAGEVIERPFSVVKELVENSLDAGAADIQVTLEEGGKALIRVIDNGHGMTAGDAKICFLRHSTSKISGEDDLEHISSLGFRGEALPSISAVSRVTLKTAAQGKAKGTEIRREGEKELAVLDTAFPAGTSIEVKDLFFNMPARRKFLRSERSELTRITKTLTEIALASPGVRFTLVHNKREIFKLPAVKTHRERIFQLFGKKTTEFLIDVDHADGNRRITGHVTRPPGGRGDRTRQYFYVNRRPVKDRTLQAALNQALRGFLEKDRFPECWLFLTLPYDEVDVNVHPAKTEVRFNDTSGIFRLVKRGIEGAVLAAQGLKDISLPRVEEGDAGYWIKDRKRPPSPGDRYQAEGEPLSPDMPFAAGVPPDHGRDLFAGIEEKGEGIPAVLGQYKKAYIIAGDREGLLIIDQHNAHERVLFEEYSRIKGAESWPRKMSLMPLVFELSPSQFVVFEAEQILLEEAGFTAEAMGGRSVALKEYPDIFQEGEARDVFFTLLEELGGDKIEDRRRHILATMACRSAVKYGEPLSRERMEYLVEKLFQTDNPSLCPHGRPIIIRISDLEIEKGLKRR
jgi:DNA mismatch repair protein MutL